MPAHAASARGADGAGPDEVPPPAGLELELDLDPTKRRGEEENPTTPRNGYFADGPPRLSWRQAQIYGLVSYDEDAGDRDALAAATARGVRFV